MIGNDASGAAALNIRRRSDHRIEFTISINSTYLRVIGTGTTQTRDGWTHLVITKPNNSISADVKFYLNGAEDSRTVQNNNLSGSAISSGDFFIGTETAASTSYFLGSIDNVAIFDAELSSGQAAGIYNNSAPKSLEGHANIVNWWPMGDGDTHPTLFDRVGTSDLTFDAGDSSDFDEEYPK